jgi:hypothetical protein
MMAPRMARPPITPPAMAPTGVDFLGFECVLDDDEESEGGSEGSDTGPVDGLVVVSGLDAKPSEPMMIS